MDNLLASLERDKIKINWNKNPIKMKDFLGFLTVKVTKSTDHLGCGNGWTQYRGDGGLIISGGWVSEEYLDSLQYGKNLANVYNNYVNPFYLFDILNEDGQKFFLDYYREDILKALELKKSKIESLKKQILAAEASLTKSMGYLAGIGFVS